MNNSTITLVALVALLGLTPVIADDAILIVAPEKCVAFRKGQVCYQRLRLSFQVPEKGNYCIFVENQVEPLQCFTNVSSGELVYRFASDDTMVFNLMNEKSVRFASGQVTVAWVYKRSRKRNRWRLF